MSWMHALGGRFVVFDGPDGSGKSTQFARFADACREAGVNVCEVREPGGTAIGEQIRAVLLDPANGEMSLLCELMLYMASRAQLVESVIRPALAADRLVLADRFISSTLAYQGTAGGLDRDAIMAVGEVAVGGCWPDLVVVFDVDEPTAARRLGGGGGGRRAKGPAEPTLFSDRMERKGAEFRRRVREGYLEQARRDPEHYLVVAGGGEPDEVYARLVQGLAARFAGDAASAGG